MPKRSSKKAATTPKTKAAANRLRTALAKRTKAELVDVIMEVAEQDRGVMRWLEARFGGETPAKELIEATHQAIADATDFDEREINYNFDYDYEAYLAVKRNFERLIKMGHLPETMELSLELMEQGSHQVEMSDEGLMTEDIEECLRVVIEAIEKSGVPAKDVTAWCAAMAKKDRVGCIADEQLQSLANQFDK